MTISFKQLEADFQRTLNEYKNTYQDYMVELNNQNGSYWNTEENVTVSNRLDSARIPFLTQPGISKKECLHSCASDPQCRYVLFSDSGNGECAANQCLKWTKDAAGIVAASSEPKFFEIYVGNSNSQEKKITLPESGMTVYPTPINKQGKTSSDSFSVSVSGNELTVKRKDKNTGWGQQLELQGLKNASGFKDYILNVGPSDSNKKSITLPETGMVVDPNPVNRQNLEWSDRFSVSVDGNTLTVTRTDSNVGWSQELQLRGAKGTASGFLMDNKACAPGEGPLQTNYTYSGWEKPTWKDSNNLSFMGDPAKADPAKWKDLGQAMSLAACKEMSVKSSKGPFGSIVFVDAGNKCFGGVPDAAQENLKMEGIYSSIPPMGSTNLGGVSTLDYIEKLQKLNDSLKDMLYRMRSKLEDIEQDNSADKKTIDQTYSNIQTDYKKLNNDRKKLKELEETLNSLDTKIGMLEALTTHEKMLYMGSALLILALFAFILRKYS